MPLYRVKLISSNGTTPLFVGSDDGELVSFRIRPLEDGRGVTHMTLSRGGLFEHRCKALIAAGGVIVEAMSAGGLYTESWRASVVQRALEQATND